MRRLAPLLTAALAAGPARAAAAVELGVPELAPTAPLSALAIPAPAAALSLPLFPSLAPALAPRPLASAALAAVPASAAAAAAAAPLALDASAGVYERRGVGLLAVDFKDSTRLHLAQGNRRAHEIVAGALDYAAAAASVFDGAVVRRVGDGYLIAFPSFTKALAAAAAIQGGLESWRRGAGAPPLALRAAAHGGRVLVDASGRSPEVYGQAVERTFALASASRGGDVAVDAGLADHAALRRAAQWTAAEGADGAILLRPRAQGPAAAPAVEPPLAATSFVAAATLFAGLADWSSTYQRYGRRAAYATVKAFHEHVRAAVERAGGFVVKTDGETVMASFPSAAAAVRAGGEIQSRLGELRRAAPLGRLVSARVGVSWGRVLREDRVDGPDFFGNSVNAAARLMRQAGDGEVLVSRAALADPDAARTLAGAARESASLKGFDARVEVLRLRPEPAAEDPDRERGLREAAQAAQDRVAR